MELSFILKNPYITNPTAKVRGILQEHAHMFREINSLYSKTTPCHDIFHSVLEGLLIVPLSLGAGHLLGKMFLGKCIEKISFRLLSATLVTRISAIAAGLFGLIIVTTHFEAKKDSEPERTSRVSEYFKNSLDFKMSEIDNIVENLKAMIASPTIPFESRLALQDEVRQFGAISNSLSYIRRIIR